MNSTRTVMVIAIIALAAVAASIGRAQEESFDAREQNFRGYVTLLSSPWRNSVHSNDAADNGDSDNFVVVMVVESKNEVFSIPESRMHSHSTRDNHEYKL